MGIQMNSMKDDLKGLLKRLMMVVHWGCAMDYMKANWKEFLTDVLMVHLNERQWIYLKVPRRRLIRRQSRRLTRWYHRRPT